MENVIDEKIYLIGSGIGSLSAAYYFIKDGKKLGKNIFILEELNISGGSMDGAGDEKKGFVIRGGRMFNLESYECMYTIMDDIPSLDDPKKTAKQDFFEFNTTFKTNSQARLVDKNAKVLKVDEDIDLNWTHCFDLLKLQKTPEKSLDNVRINECFKQEFFATRFWYMWATTFAFQPWHSAIEFKRYLHKFIHEFPRIHNLGGIIRSKYNQYHSIILPLKNYLVKKGVNFLFERKVVDIVFKKISEKKKCVEKIMFKDLSSKSDNKIQEIIVDEKDYVLFINGCMTDAYSLGSNEKAADFFEKKEDSSSFALWEKIAKNFSDFGKPSDFFHHVDESLWQSFTVTQKDSLFIDLEIEFSKNQPGTGGLVTFKDSNWLMSIVVPKQPHFVNQPKDVFVFWGYGLFPKNKGNFVNKRMLDCTGAEIMFELIHHLKFEKNLDKILKSSNCIPCIMPYITSQFNNRSYESRPQVVPKSVKNFAFLGQYAEVKDDTVFTVEYSVKSAKMAVGQLLNLNLEIPEIYFGERHPLVMMKVLGKVLLITKKKMFIALLIVIAIIFFISRFIFKKI